MKPVMFLILMLGSSLFGTTDEDAPTWTTISGPSGIQEQTAWMTTPEGIRIFLNRPVDNADEKTEGLATQSPNKPIQLLIYATPNGNTAEETIGSRPHPELPFRFGIQHFLAQTRFLRTIDTRETIILAVVQAPKLSWPAFRGANEQAGAKIPELVETLQKLVHADTITLSGHSGGGAFLLEYIQRQPTIPDNVERLLFLDAIYSWDNSIHRDKVDRWLNLESQRHLISIAYDDREITLNGRKVIGPDGGTWRATERMKAGFAAVRPLFDDMAEPFLRTHDDTNQVMLLRHPNPENRILHTSLVGDMNGLIAGMTLGKPVDTTWGKLGDPPVYNALVPELPMKAPSQWNATVDRDAAPVELPLPERTDKMPGGRHLSTELNALPLSEREQRIEKEILSGNVPSASRQIVTIRFVAKDAQGERHSVVVRVAHDVLSLGSDADSLRIPMTPGTANRLADQVGCSLMTTLLSDIVFDAADARLIPSPLTEDRESVATFMIHHDRIEEALRQYSEPILIAGHKKDIVQTSKLTDDQHVALYGWHLPHGTPIQPLYVKHFASYVDYSHGVRLVDSNIEIDGRTMTIESVLQNKNLRPLINRD